MYLERRSGLARTPTNSHLPDGAAPWMSVFDGIAPAGCQDWIAYTSRTIPPPTANARSALSRRGADLPMSARRVVQFVVGDRQIPQVRNPDQDHGFLDRHLRRIAHGYLRLLLSITLHPTVRSAASPRGLGGRGGAGEQGKRAWRGAHRSGRHRRSRQRGSRPAGYGRSR